MVQGVLAYPLGVRPEQRAVMDIGAPPVGVGCVVMRPEQRVLQQVAVMADPVEG